MARTKTKPGPKPQYGERKEIHVQVPLDDLEYIRATTGNVTGWVIAAIQEKRQREESEKQPPQELIDWLDETRDALSQGTVIVGDTPKAYIVTGTRPDGTHKEWRALDAGQAEQMGETLWQQGRWSSIAINGMVCYPLEGEAGN
jgi:hypothetical protein